MGNCGTREESAVVSNAQVQQLHLSSLTAKTAAVVTLYIDLKVCEVASLFQIYPIARLASNAIDISYPDVEHHIWKGPAFEGKTLGQSNGLAAEEDDDVLEVEAFGSKLGGDG
ncbi:hypothetical protein K1719_028091 [Acacia pycnantha]|nr:hypothetical protein K1719_028091 [Acacia pycnantha]